MTSIFCRSFFPMVFSTSSTVICCRLFHVVLEFSLIIAVFSFEVIHLLSFFAGNSEGSMNSHQCFSHAGCRSTHFEKQFQ
uniref:Secreted protein n=1 Tax=Haemonchus placei TaxID=6290 RepID=A0A0N4VYF6_HAEPC